MKPTDSQLYLPPTPRESSIQEATATFQALSSLKSAESRREEGPHEPTRYVEGFIPWTRDKIQELEKAIASFPEVGSRFLGFQLISELGKGTFGRVYLAKQGELADRSVALKISPDVGKESRNLARLQHANIVPIHSVHHAPPWHAICMPFLGARTLADLVGMLKRAIVGNREAVFESFPFLRGKSPTVACLHLIRGVAEGLNHAHERGVLHCDLKPANILLSDEGVPMLLDFNLSQDFQQAAKGATGGSLSYMAPEHLNAFLSRDGSIDERGDLYSVGIILFELLTTSLPFPSHKQLGFQERVTQLRDDRLKGAGELQTDDPEVTPAVRSIVRKLLEPDPEKRYRSAVELREDLDRHLADRTLKYAPDRSWGERWAKFRRRNPRMTSVVSLAFLSLALVGILSLAVVIREQRLARAEARDTARTIEGDRRDLEFALTAGASVNPLDRGLAQGDQILERHGLTEDNEPIPLKKLVHLPEDEREKATGDLTNLVYLTAYGHVLKGKHPTTTDRKEEFERAEKLLDKMATLQGNAPALRGVLQLQAEIAESRGQDDEAARLRKLADETPLRSVGEYHSAAVAAVKRKQYAEAVRLLDEALRLDPSHYNSWFLLGICEEYRSRPRESASAFSTCLALRQDFHAAYYNRGIAYLHLGRYPEARQDFDETIRLKPDFVSAYVNRALSFERTNDLKSAVADLTEAIRLAPESSRLYLLRARFRQQQQDEVGAAEDREAGLRFVPTDAVGWVTRGIAKLPINPNDAVTKPDPKGALADFEQALVLEPSYLDALRNKAHVLSRYQKDNEGSLAVLTETLRHYPRDVGSWAGRGVLHARLGKKAEALRDADQALALDYSPKNQYQVAGIYALLSKDDPEARAEAFRLLKSALLGGFGFEYLDIDRDLDPIRNDPRFRQTIESARERIERNR